MLKLWCSWPPFSNHDLGLDQTDDRINNIRWREEFVQRLTSKEAKALGDDLLEKAIRKFLDLTRIDIKYRFDEEDRDPLRFLNSLGVPPFGILDIMEDAQVRERTMITRSNHLKAHIEEYVDACKTVASMLDEYSQDLQSEINIRDVKALGELISGPIAEKYHLPLKRIHKKRRLPPNIVSDTTLIELIQFCMSELSDYDRRNPKVFPMICQFDLSTVEGAQQFQSQLDELNVPDPRRPDWVVSLRAAEKKRLVAQCIHILLRASFPHWFKHLGRHHRREKRRYGRFQIPREPGLRKVLTACRAKEVIYGRSGPEVRAITRTVGKLSEGA